MSFAMPPILGRDGLSPERLAAANISPVTGLATDYLNVFNEVAMLVEMAAMDEGCSAEVLAWAPVPYERHFEQSGFRDKALALEAYAAAPPQARAAFQAACARIEGEVAAIQALIRAGKLDPETAAALAAALFDAIAAASAVIDGGAARDQAAVDDLLASR